MKAFDTILYEAPAEHVIGFSKGHDAKCCDPVVA